MKLELGVIGCGVKACQYIDTWLKREDVNIQCIADPNKKALNQVKKIAQQNNRLPPEDHDSWQDLLNKHAHSLNCVYICTPHVAHAEQAMAALNSKLHVLLEKPMVTSVNEANALQRAQSQSNTELVVAYQGGLSPLVHQLKRDIAENKYGALISISANIWENWADTYAGHWKQKPEISGGGFMFDTGAHLMNTTSMLCNSDFASVSALTQNRNRPVDIVTTVMGALDNGTLFTMQASGESIGCSSRIECYFSKHIVRICAWGRWMEVQDSSGDIKRFEQESANNLVNVFQKTILKEIDNPSDIQQGLKMAKLWDAIKASSAKQGQAVFL